MGERSKRLTKPNSGHTKKALLIAVLVNSLVALGEALAGYHANSLSVAADALHNCSDELALVLLFLAYSRTERFAGRLGSTANFINALGIVLLATAIVALAIDRFGEPPEVSGSITIAAGLAAALGNLAVAAALRRDARNHTEIRLAYLHNLGDVAFCLSTALSGLLIIMSDAYWLDCAFAVCVALMLVICAGREFVQISAERRGGDYSSHRAKSHLSNAPSGSLRRV